jgi:aryl-alcohol dehydrogenase-like predicted oxidoreductase
VTVVGLGLAALGRPAYINLGHKADLGADRSPEALRARTDAVLDHAYDAGVRYFDAARSYGLAEEFLGGWLRSRAPADVTVASKWGYTYTANWLIDVEAHEVKDLSVATLRRQLQETREHLGDRLALYQIHSATIESGVLDDAEVLSELASLRAGGVAIGLTATGPDQAATIDRALATGAFDSVQATWNLYERAAAGALERAHAAGLRVVVKEGVANGRLAGDAAPPALADAARERGVGADAIALAAALAQPWSDVVLSGASTTAMLDSNLAALGVEFDGELVERLTCLAEPSDDYWAERGTLAWN